MDSATALDDLDLLRTFLVVAQEGSLTRASARLFRTQSALTRRLQVLEEAVGASLFRRTKSGVLLTPVGERFLEPARDLLRSRDRLVELGTGGMEPRRGRLRIACSDTVARYLLAPKLPALLSDHPDLELELKVSNTPQTIGSVETGDSDIGFVLLPARHKALEFQPIRSYRHMAAFPQGTAPRGREIALVDLLANPLVLLDRTTRTRQLIDASLLARGLFVGRLTEVGNVSVQKALVRAGLGVGILPDYAREGADGLVWRNIAGASERVLASCRRQGSPPANVEARLLELLRSR